MKKDKKEFALWCLLFTEINKWVGFLGFWNLTLVGKHVMSRVHYPKTNLLGCAASMFTNSKLLYNFSIWDFFNIRDIFFHPIVQHSHRFHTQGGKGPASKEERGLSWLGPSSTLMSLIRALQWKKVELALVPFITYPLYSL